MPAGITFQVKDSFISRQYYIKQYKSEVLKIRNNPEFKNNRREKLDVLREKFVKKYMEIDKDISAYQLKELVDVVFFEFDWKKIDVPSLVSARDEVLNLINETKPTAKTKGLVKKAFGTDKFLDENKLSYFDALLISKVRTRREMIDKIKTTYQTFDDCFFAETLQQLHKQDLDGSIILTNNIGNAKNYWYKICSLASTYKEKDDFDIEQTLSHTQEKEITRLPSVKSPDKIERLYLEMYYSEESSYSTTTHYYDAPSETETHHRTETRDLNPKYVKEHLPIGLSLKKDKKGYYLVLEAQEISKRKLADIGKRYNPDLTISVLQASC